MQPFKLNIHSDILEEISNRLKSTRLPEDFGNQDWRYGTEKSYLKNLLKYWIEDYDWKITEKEIKLKKI